MAVLLASRSAHAQEPPRPAEPAAPAERDATLPSGDAERDAEVDALIEDLVAAEPGDDDVAWLFSNAAEYAEPTRLTGKPFRSDALPERGEGSRRLWNPSWRKFGVGNYILTGSAVAVGMAASAIPKSPDRWRGKNSFDESVRDAIGIKDFENGIWARDGSDLLVSVSVAYPLLFDSLIVMYWYRQSHAVAAQMALITAEAVSVAAAVQGLTAGFASRERPYGRNCGDEVDAELDYCDGNRRYRSFFSGHTAMAFAGAGVTCSHHAVHDVYGSPGADAAACGVAMLAAAGTGALRIVGEQHYMSDVLVGAGIGTLSGVGIPWLLHYGPLARVSADRKTSAMRLNLVGVPGGLGVGGQF